MEHDEGGLYFLDIRVNKTDSALGNTFQQPPAAAYRRAKNIKDSVVRSDISQGANKTSLLLIPPGNYKCGNCTQCQYTKHMKGFSHPKSGRDIKI
ncbi:unnamed protein product, partial [Coregonus sp. 'balchen']